MNSLTHSCMHSFASFAILALSGRAFFMIRATGAKLRMLASRLPYFSALEARGASGELDDEWWDMANPQARLFRARAKSDGTQSATNQIVRGRLTYHWLLATICPVLLPRTHRWARRRVGLEDHWFLPRRQTVRLVRHLWEEIGGNPTYLATCSGCWQCLYFLGRPARTAVSSMMSAWHVSCSP